MKFWAAASLALLLVPAAAAQKLSHEYLVRLPDADFPPSLRAKGITPLHHAGQVWAVRTSNEKVLRQSTEQITPAMSVIIELQPGAKDITRTITDAGGIVTHIYRSIPALAAFVPTSKIGELQSLPGIKRLSKSRVYSPLQHTSE